MKLSKYFTLKELTRSDTAVRLGIDNTPPPEVIANLKALCLAILDPVREHFGKPVRPTSGYRAPAVNKVVGGNEKGQHPKGEACDFEIDDVDNLAAARWIATSGLEYDQLICEHYQPGIPTSGWIHASHKKAGGNRGEVLTAARDPKTGKTVYSKGLPDD